MSGDVQLFSECLHDIMQARQWSVESLAAMTGYKSRTSITRILREQSGPQNRVRFFELLCKSKMLTPEEEERLKKALNVSLCGKDRTNAQQIFARLVSGKMDTGSFEMAGIQRLLNMLNEGEAFHILLINCVYVPLFDLLREMLAQRAACSVRHYFILEESETDVAQTLYCLSRTAYLPNYKAFICNHDAADEYMPPRINLFSARVEKADGLAMDVLAVFSNSGWIKIHQIPSADGLHNFVEHIFDQQMASCQPITRSCDISSGPASFLDTMRCYEAYERDNDTYNIKAGFCANAIPTHILRATLDLHKLSRIFSDVGAGELKKMLDAVLYYQHLRYRDTFEGKKRRNNIFSTGMLKRFAQTGLIAEHFIAMRPFSVQERIAILENLLMQACNNKFFFLYFFKDGFEPAYEVNCFDGVGIGAFPINRENAYTNNFCYHIIYNDRLTENFKDYFLNYFKAYHTIPVNEGLELMRSLIAELKSTNAI